MNLDIEFLAHYRGDSKTDSKVKERLAWSRVNVDLQTVPFEALELKMHFDNGYYAAFESDKVYCYLGHWWVIAEGTNAMQDARWSIPSGRGGTDDSDADISNFDISAQRMFTWKAFQFRLFDRHPAPNVYSMEPQHFRLYKPGEALEWDDTPKIEKRAAKFYRENLLVAGDRVFCRIEHPCLYTRSRSYRPDYIRILTPFGGFGDPLIDFDTAYAVTWDIASTGRGYRGQPTVSYDRTSGEVPGDGLERFVRACFGDLFDSHPWYGRGRECMLTSADRKSLPALHRLWRDNLDSITPTVLDAAVDIMMPFARKSGFEHRLRDWLDRPIDSPVDLFG